MGRDATSKSGTSELQAQHEDLISTSDDQLVRSSDGSVEVGGASMSTPSPDFVQSSEASIPPATGSRWNPPAPTTRNRGFSLRRAAFALNHARTGPAAIELEPQQEIPPPGDESKGTSGEGQGGITEAIVSSASFPESSSSDGKHSTPNSMLQRPGLRAQSRIHVTRLRSTLTKVFKIITRTQDIPPSKDGRHIDLNPPTDAVLVDERTGKAYISNTITSSRYNFFNFLPRQLIFQFSRVSNFYFLCIAVLQLTGFSTTGTYSTLVPLMAFVTIAMAKEGFDDYRRHLLDKIENHDTIETLCRSVSNGQLGHMESVETWTEVKWSAVKVGDVVKLKRDDPIPADLVLVFSDGPSGMAYIDTAALDGESNLKAKQASALLRKVCREENDVPICQAHVVVEDPNIDLYNFDGRITIGEETLPLTGNEVIYRGSVLRNTANAFGMVINTGEECKIRMNATKNAKAKAPSMQRIVNQIVVVIAIFVLVLTGLNVAAYSVWKRKQENHFTYLMGASVGYGELLASTFVMFSTTIPLALYISMEIVKVGQMYIMGDIEMYDSETDTPMEPRTNTINEELGQISHVFSDKTGTLTENIMRFRKMSVAGTAWLHNFDLKKPEILEKVHTKQSDTTVQVDKLKPSGHTRQISAVGALPISPYASERTELALVATRSSNPRRSEIGARPSTSLYRQPVDPKAEPTTEELVAYLQRHPEGVFARKARFFLLAIALCHTALPELQENGEIDYQAMSPDESALVRAAKDLGYIVVDRPNQSITIVTRVSNTPVIESRETYEVLDVVEFSSKRKRMSIVIRFPDGRICLFCKGADSTIIPRLKSAREAAQKDEEIRRSMTAQRRSESRDELRRQSEDRPRISLSRPSFNRSRSQLSRPSFVSRRSHTDGRSSIEVLGRILHDSPRPSLAASRKSSYFGNNFMIDHSVAADDSATLVATLRHIHEFATEGLRTLMYGYRYLGDEEYQTWKQKFHAASTSLVNRQELIDQASKSLEQELELAGATAIEDELQKGVPETIDKLRRAGMRVWMLTGDKRETAINIGHSCKLITSYSEVIVLDHEKNNVGQAIASALHDIQQGEVAHSVVVVDGQTLSDIEENPVLADPFFELVIAANSVICCRASPTQKAFLVKTIRTKVKGSVTLAIGDSANDIAMIQEAHVGIGISGKEGMQAARTSDYSIGQFRFLQRLLLVHGRWNYVRTGKYILGTFWKEMMFFLTQAIYQGYNGFTGTSLYEYWSGSVINVIFCALCIIFLGMFDQDLEASTLLAVPELYRLGQRNGAFNLKLYAWWNFMALTDAVIIFYFVYLAYGMAQFNDVFVDSSDIFAYGQLAFAVCIVVINTKLMFLVMHNRNIISLIGWFCGVGGWWLWNLIINQVYNPSTSFYGVKHGFVDRFGRSSLWWLTLILAAAAVMLWEVAVEAARVACFPNEVDVFQELEREQVWKRRFNGLARGEGKWDEVDEEEKD